MRGRAACARHPPTDRHLRVPTPGAGTTEHDGLDELTTREREVFSLIATGLTNAEIAQTLQLSPLTAKTHVSRMLMKLGARDRVQLVVIAYQSGIVDR